MKKNFTPSTMTIHAEATMSERQTPRPSKMTLDFIKQFARSYHFESRINTTLSGMIVN